MSMSNQGSSGTLTVRVTEDFVLNAGNWSPTIEQDSRRIAHIAPPPVPMFQQVVEYLESNPVPPDGYVLPADEARAAVAVCLRWGSYFAVLADASRQFSPNIHDETVSQIDDEEMARMNIEISAAIQWWLTLKGSGAQRYTQLLQRALGYLPLGGKTVTRSPEGDVLTQCATAAMATAVRRAWPAEQLGQDLRLAETHGLRVIANTITLLSWRNGPIEHVHAGHSFGHAHDDRRILPRQEKAIIRHTQNGLYAALRALEHLAFEGAWPPLAERILPFMRPFCHPRSWSYTEQSRVVQLPPRRV